MKPRSFLILCYIIRPITSASKRNAIVALCCYPGTGGLVIWYLWCHKMRRQDIQSTSLVVSLLHANRTSETPELVDNVSASNAGRGRKRKANHEVKRDSLRKRTDWLTHKLKLVEEKAKTQIAQLVEFEKTTLGSLVTNHAVCVIPRFSLFVLFFSKNNG